MKRSCAMAVGVLVAFVTSAARADTVTDWNQTAIEVMKVAGVVGNPWSRTLAMVHVGMSDAINSVQPRYARYVTSIPKQARRIGGEPQQPLSPGKSWFSSIPIRKQSSRRLM